MEELIADLDANSMLKRAGEVSDLDLTHAALLSLVEGEVELGSIALQMGLPVDEAIEIAATLIQKGALVLASPPSDSRDTGAGSSSGKSDDERRVPLRESKETTADEGEDEIELDPLRRALVDSTYEALKSASLYEILELSPDADAREIRDAYFRLSKLFHPDTLYGKRLGAYREKMETIFREMTAAYEVLSRRKRRAEYDERLGEERLAALRKRMLGSIDAPSAPQKKRQLDVEARRRLAARRLRGGLSTGVRAGARSVDGPSRPRSGGAQGDGLGKLGDARDAAQALLRSIDSRNPRNTPVDAIARRAARAEEEERYEEALNHWLAIERLEPDWPGLEEKLDELRAIVTRASLAEYRTLAAAHLRAGRLREAALVYQRICTGAPDDVEAHLTTASIFRQMEPPDLRSARDYAQRAQQLDPGRVSIRILLVRIYADAGMKHNAIRYLDEILRDHPEDLDAQALRRELMGAKP